MIVFLRLGRMSEAQSLARTAILTLSDHGGPPAVRMGVLAALSEVLLFSGELRRSLEYAALLRDHALHESDERWHYRALSLIAASSSLEGLYVDAERAIAQMREIVLRNNWPKHWTDLVEAVAQAILSLNDWNSGRLSVAIELLSGSGHQDPATLRMAEFLETIRLIVEGNPHRAMVVANRILQSVPSSTGEDMVRDYGKLLIGFILLREREPLRAMGQVRDVEANDGHVVCPAAIRATAHVQLGDYDAVLSETADCMKKRVKHNMWLFPMVLLCRAIANLRKGHRVAALRNANAALSHNGGNTYAAAFALLPVEDISDLLDLVDSVVPRAVVDTTQFHAALVRSGGVGGASVVLPKLSSRETVVAQQLQGGQAFSVIAKELHVALGTVKSQAASVYRKLGVTTRDEAVHLLEEAGFFES
jgi:DNA-binding CsgD family transcriptional regulator